MVEAIKVKNTIVVERFKIAEKAHEALVSLTVKIEDDLVEFQKKHNDSNKFFSKLKYEFHPIYYRAPRLIKNPGNCGLKKEHSETESTLL